MSQSSSNEPEGIIKQKPSARSNAHVPFFNKAARTAMAKETINKTIPDILSSNERAKRGVKSAQLLRDLPKLASASGRTETEASLHVSVIQSDTLAAAQLLHSEHPHSKIAVLNMASPMQPGGGVLRGAKAQEESLCMRSTLYHSLKMEWYRLPDDAIVYTPDVLVFKSANSELRMLDASERFYVDVISCAAVRMPELDDVQDESGEKQLSYADPKDEELMSLKIKYIMRTAAKMGVQRLVLGALGCGAYRNPINLVAKMMRRCLLGRDNKRGAEENWALAGIEQVVIAILDETPERKVWTGFANEFSKSEGVFVEGSSHTQKDSPSG
jgi:uncharacterized protein (TIGR02452 family)